VNLMTARRSPHDLQTKMADIGEGFALGGQGKTSENGSLRVLDLRSLRFKLGLVIGLLVLIIIAPASLAWVAVQDGRHSAERARQAHEVLDTHLELSERSHRLLHHIDDGGMLDDATGQKLQNEIQLRATRIRKLVAEEIALIGEGGMAEEEIEISRIDEIMASLDQASRGQPDERWQALIDDAVIDERGEVAQIDMQTRKVFTTIGWTLFFVSLLTAFITALALYWFRNSLALPINRLLDGTRALANGDYTHRIKPSGDAEFQKLAASFNLMAARMQSSSSALESDNDALEAMVAERTSALETANEQLNNAAERRNQFLTDISHELRTPLAIIRGEAEVTLRGADKSSEEYRASLGRVADQVGGMARLVDDLLYVARSEAGAPKLKLRPVNLRKLADTATRDLRVLIEADDGSISFDAQANSASVLGDADRLSQLLHILLDNAIHYSEGPPQIAVSLLPSPDGYMLIVADHGIGISPEDLPHVFDRYHRGRLAKQQNGSGIGIGLPMAKAIAEGHGGTISIESTVGEGTSVSVFLPGADGVRAAA
jgi:two-component system, OmpR family, sensor kinase